MKNLGLIKLEDIILLGGGKHCASVIDSIRNQGLYHPVGILDIPEKVGTSIQGVSIINTDDQMATYFNKGIKHAFVSIGSVGNTVIREKLVKLATETGFSFPNIIDPSAIVSSQAQIDEGVFVGKGSIINVNTKIGAYSIINTGTIIEHDCEVGAYVHVAPGSTFSGSVKIGDYTHIGTNSTVIQEVSVGSRTLIGAGSVVIKDIGDHKKAYGNPCKEI